MIWASRPSADGSIRCAHGARKRSPPSRVTILSQNVLPEILHADRSAENEGVCINVIPVLSEDARRGRQWVERLPDRLVAGADAPFGRGALLLTSKFTPGHRASRTRGSPNSPPPPRGGVRQSAPPLRRLRRSRPVILDPLKPTASTPFVRRRKETFHDHVQCTRTHPDRRGPSR